MTNKLKYFIGNWKMFGDFSSLKIINRIDHFNKRHQKLNKKNKIILCVPSTLIDFFSKRLKRNSIQLGAQNCHHSQKYGPYTGSVSASMLKKAGAKYIILGHSENRLEGETNQLINKKIKSVINENLKVIFCIGETYKEKKSGKTFSTIRNQIKKCIKQKFDSF